MSLRAPLFYVLWSVLALTISVQAHQDFKEATCFGVINDQNILDCSLKFDVPPFYMGKLPRESTIKEMDDLMFDPVRLEAAAARARDNFPREIHIYADGVELPIELVSFPSAKEVSDQSDKQGEDERYPVLMTARFQTKIPSSTRTIEILFPKELGSVLTRMKSGEGSRTLMSVPPGEKGQFKISEVHFTISGFLRDGFEHVIPSGWDHCLFMVAMVLAAVSVTEALKRSLIFTLGHAITLALVVTAALPPVTGWIEPVIAATIAVGGYLAYRQKPAKTAFLLVPLIFGLIHGLGFAAAAADKLQDLSKPDLGKLLVGFNLGVECAQASIILATAGLIFAYSKIRPDTKQLRQALGLLIAITGLIVMITRVLSLLKSD